MTAHLAAYHALIDAKRAAFQPRGFADVDEARLPDTLFPHQRHGVAFALRAGSAGLFYDTGLGKTLMELTWGDEVVRRTNRPVLMLAPLACGRQHAREAEVFGIDAVVSRDGKAPSRPRIVIANYERLDRFDPADYAGVILDESSILKSFSGVTTRKLIAAFASMPYRLSASATPAPNDHTELGQQSEFLGVMAAPEMLSRWFIADQMNAGRYRLKRPAVTAYWDWVASWARCVSTPSDLGYSDEGFVLPELVTTRHVVAADRSIDRGHERDGQGLLFRLPDTSATSIHREKRLTATARAEKIAAQVDAERGEAWVVWCDTDYDAEAFRAVSSDFVEVSGKMHIDLKEERLEAFTNGEIKHLLTKPSIAGYGLNWQHCARTGFTGLSFSYEAYYQAIRRFLRFRQERPVHAHIACADTEESIWTAVSRKAGDHDTMRLEMAAAMRRAAVGAETLHRYHPTMEATLPAWMTA